MLTLAAIAATAWALLSLIALSLGRAGNPGGPLGEALAGALTRALGDQAYVAVIMAGLFGWRLWKSPPIGALVCEVGGGAAVILALCTAAGLAKYSARLRTQVDLERQSIGLLGRILR